MVALVGRQILGASYSPSSQKPLSLPLKFFHPYGSYGVEEVRAPHAAIPEVICLLIVNTVQFVSLKKFKTMKVYSYPLGHLKNEIFNNLNLL